MLNELCGYADRASELRDILDPAATAELVRRVAAPTPTRVRSVRRDPRRPGMVDRRTGRVLHAPLSWRYWTCAGRRRGQALVQIV